MALPNTAPIDLLAVGVEAGVTTPVSLIDTKIRTLAGKPSGEISLLDLLGKSAKTYYLTGGFQTMSGTMGRVYDRGDFYVNKENLGLPNPTAYQWLYTDYGGQLMPIGGTTSSTLQLRGPDYDGFGTSFEIVVSCRITVNGVVQETPEISRTYTSGIM